MVRTQRSVEYMQTRMNRGDQRRGIDVNDFDAIRISLASPEDIREWSKGEVTKPETINYRTLKPEHGGLFCERIFGPTRDWECYCGKFKRIRHAGTVCDKCGVEVTRSKVRRERMAHIALASPVTHIWYVKGTPSRLGLLLGVSPRDLERVLYFASYLIIHVDEEQRASVLEQIDAAFLEAKAELEDERKKLEEEVSDARDAQVGRIRSTSSTWTQEFQDGFTHEMGEIEAEAAEVSAHLEEFSGTAAEEDITFRGEMVVQAGEAINEDRIDRLRDLRKVAADAVNQRREDAIANARAQSEGEINVISVESKTTLTRVTSDHDAQASALKKEADDLRKKIRNIKELTVLTESEYRELLEDAPGVFRAGMGAESVYEVVKNIDLATLAVEQRGIIDDPTSSAVRRTKAAKRLRVIEALRQSNNRPEWMIFTVLPVIPPDLRPMVQLDGGRFATSDLNDLYRRVINRNNRLKRLQELGAPDIIVRNEKRMLQEAVDALIDNGRRGRVVSGSGKHKLKSLSDMLKGKQGRFRQNLLGKRVDYSGRSVIVVGPNLKLDECGLPKRMALELFKPFVMRKLVDHGFAHNIKAAKRLVERVDERVWGVLEEVIQDYVVLLNRAPTLHRLGIQAFKVRLIEGSAIHIHPLVCAAFNADFDGDQMAVHVPLSRAAQREARARMLSTANLLDPSDGDPVIAPTLEIVLGCYYMTLERHNVLGEGKIFSGAREVLMAYQLDRVHIHAPIRVLNPKQDSSRLLEDSGAYEPEGIVDTTVGRVLFNHELPIEMGFRDEVMDRKALRRVISDCYHQFGPFQTAEIADRIKGIGFQYSTRGGLSIATADLNVPNEKNSIIAEARAEQVIWDDAFNIDLTVAEDEYHQNVSRIWSTTRDRVQEVVAKSLGEDNSLYMMATSGAKGNDSQISQMAGMRGLMADTGGRAILKPITSNFREGLSVLEYFISTHGARKGLADTALRTADSGYLTRRLVDVAQDVIVTMHDCETKNGIVVDIERVARDFNEEKLASRLIGRVAAAPVVTADGEMLVDRNDEITEDHVVAIRAAGVTLVKVRTTLECEAAHGVCAACYGRNLATGRSVELGEAVGIIAAQSIGEPGTQLTMRTFHTGGISVASGDIVQGLPRVEELFEAREPKNKAIVSDIEGIVEVYREQEQTRILVKYDDEINVPVTIAPGFTTKVVENVKIARGEILAENAATGEAILSPTDGTVYAASEERVVIHVHTHEESQYLAPPDARVRPEEGSRVNPGDVLVALPNDNFDPRQVLVTRGRESVQQLLVDEVQKVYIQQAVETNDKHIETIVRQMLRKLTIDHPGDANFLPGESVDRFTFISANEEVLAQGGTPATAQESLLGITKASLATDSFLSAASFQETTRVLTEAAVNGRIDYLRGLKENVIIGKLIPAGTGYNVTVKPEEVLTAADEVNLAAMAPPAEDLGVSTIEQVEALASGENAPAAVSRFDLDVQSELAREDDGGSNDLDM